VGRGFYDYSDPARPVAESSVRVCTEAREHRGTQREKNGISRSDLREEGRDRVDYVYRPKALNALTGDGGKSA